jgi:hypothetical protein
MRDHIGNKRWADELSISDMDGWNLLDYELVAMTGGVSMSDAVSHTSFASAISPVIKIAAASVLVMLFQNFILASFFRKLR